MVNFVRPDGLAKALELLSSDQWTILAGGTDYYPALKSEAPRSPVLDISRLSELRGIRQQPDHIRIGALTTWTDIVRADLPPAFKALQLAAFEVGSIQIQNRATVGGNLCNASPAADGVPPLLILDAEVELCTRNATRAVPLQEFVRGNRRTCRREDELVSGILVPQRANHGSSTFLKLGSRKYLVISIAMVAVKLLIEGDSIRHAAIAIGACSEVATRLPEVEHLLTGSQAVSDVVDNICPSLMPQLNPIDDIRASAAYRVEAACHLVRRSVQSCIEGEGSVA